MNITFNANLTCLFLVLLLVPLEDETIAARPQLF